MKKEEYVYSVFQNVADGYDTANRRISLGMHERWKREAAQTLSDAVPVRADLLDVGCGTGDMLLILHEALPEAALTGLDFSPNMLKAAEKKCGGIAGLRLVEGNACRLPMEDSSFDGVSIAFALRNTADYEAVVSEAFRVLKPGGAFLCIDSFVPQNPAVRPFYRMYFSCAMPLIGGGRKHFTEYRWLDRSTSEFISPDELGRLFRAQGFTELREKRFMFGACAAVLGIKGSGREGNQGKI
jgi:demethylmenaquinone methyltransferase/2-methoxy-6-polyprenyl-1,4-benzoquinol methylase